MINFAAFASQSSRGCRPSPSARHPAHDGCEMNAAPGTTDGVREFANNNGPTKTMKAAGVSLIAGSVAFMAVFSYLAATFGYPDVLDRPAAEVLPLLAQGGHGLRAVWFFYGALPLVFVFAGVSSGNILERGAPSLRTLGVASAVAAGVSMMLGLLRWPTIEWALAQHWGAADSSGRTAIAAVFDASNLFLGTLLGEFVGEICAATWFLVVSIAWRNQGRRWIGNLGVAAAGVMMVAAFRNVTAAVEMVAQINNITLPLWMITMGVAMMGRPRPQPGRQR